MVRSTTWSVVVDDTRAGVVFADAATDGGPGCKLSEPGLGCTADSDVCAAIAGGRDGVPDCCALTLNMNSNELVITQGHLRIAHPSFRLRGILLKGSARVAVVLVVAAIRLAPTGHPDLSCLG